MSGERPDTSQAGGSAAEGPWDPGALELFRGYDRGWAEQALAMAANPWRSSILPPKLVELIGVAVNAACTNLCGEGARRHIRAALAAGASGDEILMVLKMASLLSIHTCSLGAPILLEEARAAGVAPPTTTDRRVETPTCDAVRQSGMWNEAWTPFYDLDPAWTEQFIAAGIPVYRATVFSAKDAELLSIAFDASITHMYAPGTRRHIKAALAQGATVEEIMEVLKVCVAEGMQAANLGLPILAEELAARS